LNSPDNEYLSNFSSSFIVETKCALPVKEDVFDYIMAKAKSWGMTLYEQVM
jgi:hypothetical protein